MKIVSRLVKMETRLGSLERKGEEILSRSDPTLDTAQTKVYMGTEDLLSIVKLINSSIVGYLFLFPVFYVAQFLRKIESHKDGIAKLWRRISILFACMLILGSVVGFQLPGPLGLFLVPFSILFLLIAFFNRKEDYVYPGAFLQGISIYLFARFLFLDDRFIPFLGCSLVLVWFFLARRWKERKEVAFPLYRCGYWAAAFFSYEAIGTFLKGVTGKDPNHIWLAIPLVLFTFYLWVRHVETRETTLQYLALATSTVAFVLILFAIPYLPLKYMGSYLTLFAILFTSIGVRYQERWGYALVQPLLRMGVVVALASFFFSFWDVNVFSLNVVLFSSLYFEASFLIAPPRSEDSGEELGWTLKNFFFLLAIVGSVAFTFVYFLFDRPLSYGTIIASLGFSYHSFRVGLRRGDGFFLKSRNEWFYLSAFFLSLGFFSLIASLIPFLGLRSLLFSIIPVVFFLLLGFSYGKKGGETVRTSLYESSYLFVIIPFFWIFSQKAFPLKTSLLLILLFALTYGGFNMKAKEKGLWYSFSFLSVFFSYSLLRLFPHQDFLGFYMIPLGWIFLWLSILLRRINHSFKTVCYLTWFLYSLASLYSLMPKLNLAGYGFVLWAVSLLVTSMLIWGKEEEMEGPIQEEFPISEAPAPWRTG